MSSSPLFKTRCEVLLNESHKVKMFGSTLPQVIEEYKSIVL